MNTTRLFVYGSLKKERFNHWWLKDQKFIDETYIRGYRLYNLTAYPCVVKTMEYDDIVHGEIYEVSLSVYEAIEQMEFGAGYYNEWVNTVGYIFLYQEAPEYAKHIESGIW